MSGGIRNLLDGPPTRLDEQVATVVFAALVLTAAILIPLARRLTRTNP